jgi:hypothetical protein
MEVLVDAILSGVGSRFGGRAGHHHRRCRYFLLTKPVTGRETPGRFKVQSVLQIKRLSIEVPESARQWQRVPADREALRAAKVVLGIEAISLVLLIACSFADTPFVTDKVGPAGPDPVGA